MTTATLSDNELYHADTTRISKSGLDLMAKSPSHYYTKYLDPKAPKESPTRALLSGSTIHAITLEIDEFYKNFVIAPKFNMKASAGREGWDEFVLHNPGKTIISMEMYEMAKCVSESVMKHPYAAELLSCGVAEQRMDWIHPDTGTRCKIKPDWHTPDRIIVDVKSTEDASPEEFGKSVYKYRYDVAGAFYGDGYEQFMGYPPAGFVLIAVEKTYPYRATTQYLEDEHFVSGRTKYMRDIIKYDECVKSGLWPGYSQELIPVQTPQWAKNKHLNQF